MHLRLLVALATAALATACADPAPTSADDDGVGGFDAASATAGGGGGPTGGGSTLTATPQPCEGPLGPARDPASLPSCGPAAHCLDAVSPALAPLVGPCDGGGFCVPDPFIATGGVISPKPCNGIGGAGACLPPGFPEIDAQMAILPQDVCEGDDRCVPCTNPLDHTSTGVCELGFTCSPGNGGAGAGGAAPAGKQDDPATCEYDGAPIVDPAGLPACPVSVCGGGGHCVAAAAVPPDLAGNLAACDAASYCVPDKFLIAGGDKIAPKTCASIGGFEGRCMSSCLPQIAAAGASLPSGPAAGCDSAEACLPCYDPITGQATGACTSLPCDKGPAHPPQTFPKCCGGIGTCIPSNLVPADQQGHLGPDTCGAAGVCAPDALMPGAQKQPWDETGSSCETDWAIWFFAGDEYKPGVCMPDCLPEIGSQDLLGQGSCQGENFRCVPCLDPTTGQPSGACN